MREGLDRALGEVAVPRVQVQQSLRRLLQVERDGARVASRGVLVLAELGRHAQMQALALAFREALIRDVTDEPVAEPPHARPLLVA